MSVLIFFIIIIIITFSLLLLSQLSHVHILVLYWEFYLCCNYKYNCNCILMVFIVCRMCLLLLCSFVCCDLFERGGLFCVLCLIVLPLRPGKNPFAVKINNNNNFKYRPNYW
jgi:hypothetical protein